MKDEKKESSKSWNHVYKGRKGFGFGVRTGRAGPGNTSIRELLGGEEYTGAVVKFLMSTKE